MTKSINSKYIFAALTVVFIFGAILVMPVNASANYGYYGNPFGTQISNRYSYYSNPPVVIQQPVVVQQPVVYVQPQPIYVQQPVVVQQPVIIQQPVYNNLAVSCSVKQVYNSSGYVTAVTWSAYASGGNGYYSYSWSGTDGLYGSSKDVYYSYSNPGLKYATVTVYSNGQSITQSCSAPVSIGQNYYQTNYQPVYQPTYQVGMYSNILDIGCYADPTNAKINQPINWTAEVTGGVAPYTYSWSGSDNLTGSQSSVIKYYSTSGSKNAIVTVTSADGRTGTKACSNALTIAAPYKAVAKKVVEKAPVTTTVVTPAPVVNSNLSAASLFSLENVPWGWVAIIIILILFFTVFYLLFNKKKI